MRLPSFGVMTTSLLIAFHTATARVQNGSWQIVHEIDCFRTGPHRSCASLVCVPSSRAVYGMLYLEVNKFKDSLKAKVEYGKFCGCLELMGNTHLPLKNKQLFTFTLGRERERQRNRGESDREKGEMEGRYGRTDGRREKR